jgi:hypothetical protein
MRSWGRRRTTPRENTEEFSEETVQEAFTRAGRRCECTRVSHNHSGRCPRMFTYEERGAQWQAHHITAVQSKGKGTLSNCEILCMAECHPKVTART